MRRWARLAGIFYLATIVTGVFAEVFVRGAVYVRDDAAATAANILARESLYRFGLVADLVMLGCYLVVTALFYLLFKPVSRGLSLLAAFFSLIGIAVLAANSINHLAPLLYLGNVPYLSVFEASQLQTLAFLSLRMHARGYSIAGVFFGVYCISIGALAYRSGFLPRVIGVLMALGGAGFLGSSFLVFLWPRVAARVPDLGMLGGIGELALALWLTVVGVRERRPLEHAA